MLRFRSYVIQAIEQLFEHTVDALLSDKPLTVKLRTRKQNAKAPEKKSLGCQSRILPSQTFSYPGSNPVEARKFGEVLSRFEYGLWLTLNLAVLIRIFELIHAALVAKVIVTKRFNNVRSYRAGE